MVGATEAVADGVGAGDEVEEFEPNVNRAGFSDDVVVVDAAAVVDNGVLVNEPNVGAVDTGVVKDKDVEALVVAGVAVGNVPNAGNVDEVLVLAGKRLLGVIGTDLSEVAVIAPNDGVAVVVVVEPNEIVTFSFVVVVDIVPNVGKETGAENDGIVVTGATDVVVVDGDSEVKLGFDLGTTGSSIIVSVVLVIEDEETGAGSIELNRL